MRFRYYTLDVFTDRMFGGNQLAVFTDARGLDDATMASLARELNLSESVFVFPPEKGGTRKVRIFTPGSELPFAGHPTVGTAHLLAAIGEVPLNGKHEATIVLEEGVGPVPVKITGDASGPRFAQLTAARAPEFGPEPPDASAIASLLSIPADRVLGAPWQPAFSSCGVPFLFVAVDTRRTMSELRLNAAVWSEQFAHLHSSEIFVYALDPELPGSHVRARMFAPALGIVEDPATGSAAASLTGVLARGFGAADGTHRWTIEQGFEMGRPSIIHIEADVVAGRVTAARVGGSSVLVGEGTISIQS